MPDKERRSFGCHSVFPNPRFDVSQPTDLHKLDEHDTITTRPNSIRTFSFVTSHIYSNSNFSSGPITTSLPTTNSPRTKYLPSTLRTARPSAPTFSNATRTSNGDQARDHGLCREIRGTNASRSLTGPLCEPEWRGLVCIDAGGFTGCWIRCFFGVSGFFGRVFCGGPAGFFVFFSDYAVFLFRTGPFLITSVCGAITASAVTFSTSSIPCAEQKPGRDDYRRCHGPQPGLCPA